MTILSNYLNILTEGKRTSYSKVTRSTKIKKATGQLSTVMARKNHDPLYKQMVYHRKKYRYFKEKLHKKYASRVRSKARR